MKTIRTIESIQIKKFSDHALAELIKMAMTEWQERLESPKVVTVKHSEQVVDIIDVPPDSVLVFINNCIKKVNKGEYIHAEMKDRWHELSKKYPKFFENRMYPDSLRGSDIKKYSSYFVDKEK